MMKKVILGGVIIICSFTAGFVASMYSYPCREFGRTWEVVAREGGKNTWFHERNLADDTSKLIVRPNNDTLYSAAALDMDSGPFVISMPPSDRYWSVEFMRDNTDVFAYIGSREYGLNKAVTVILAAKDFTGNTTGNTNGLPVLRSPCKKVWAMARILVDGKDDLPKVHQLQDRMKIIPLKEYQSSLYK